MNEPSHPIEIFEESGVRYLQFGSDWVQGAMRIRRPYALELAYTREMAAGLLFRDPPWPRRVLQIGLGAGSLAKFFHKNVPHCKLTVVEIDPRMVGVAMTQFKLPEPDPRLRIVIGDGAEYITRKTDHWDAIIVDGFDHRARPGDLDTAPFYANCRAALTAQGLVCFNLFSNRRGFASSKRYIAAAFDDQALALPPCESGNVIMFANAGDPVEASFADLRARARRLKDETGLDLRDTLTRLEANRRYPEGIVRL